MSLEEKIDFALSSASITGALKAEAIEVDN